MARLNEPPVAPGPSAETVEAVKRRFLRQNRELAKTNSQQSIRIRNLETEGSRLLAENLSLREQVLQLQNVIEARSNAPSFADIEAVKGRLEARLAEFGSLVAELGQIKKVDTGPRCKSQTAATRRSPDERQWRSGLCLQEVENAMLPTIAEDKYFPRRTMGADELQNMLDDPDSQSPDIGPPPIARFDHEDPIAFNPSPPPEEQADIPAGEPDPALSVNLETRKKRRESGPRPDMRRVSIFESPEDVEEQPSRSVRKRKFSVQEDDEKTNTQKEAFRFTRRNTPGATDNTMLNNDNREQSPERVVLGSKPVNTDPLVSPKKQRSSATEKPEKKPSATSKSSRGRLTITRTTQPELPPLQLPEPLPTTEINLESLLPKTPAVEGILSAPSTEPSTSRPNPKDTPPPADLSSSDQTGLGARPSRRARPQVSYKEPSLNTKMRRPGKELVDAVQPTHERRSSVEPASVVKREPDESNATWKTLPLASGRVTDEAEVGSPLKEKLGRREGSQSGESAPEQLQPRLNSSAASSAISALISATSTSKRKGAPASSHTASSSSVTDASTKPPKSIGNSSGSGSSKSLPALQDEKDSLAIFDFTESSPNEPPTAQSRVDLAKAARNGRRHSSVLTSTSGEEKKSEPRPKPDGTLPSLHSRSGSGAGVRSSSSSNLRKTMGTSKPPVADRKPNPVPSTSSNPDVQATVDAATTGSLRAERAASRRKSMML